MKKNGNFKTPKVSVVIPTYRRGELFREALLSAINQDYKGGYEIIVCDNDATQGMNETKRIVNEIGDSRVIYHKNKRNLGLIRNWNRCAEVANTPYIVYLHDDDVLLPDALSRLMSIQKYTGDKAIISQLNQIDSNGDYIIRYTWRPRHILGIIEQRDWVDISLFELFMGHGSGIGCGCLFARERLLELGGFKESFYPAADYALICEYNRRFGSVYNLIPTANYRRSVNVSNTDYIRFSDADLKVREHIAPYIKRLPKWWLKRLAKALYNVRGREIALNWGDGKKDILNVGVTDRLLVWIADNLNLSAKIRHGRFAKIIRLQRR